MKGYDSYDRHIFSSSLLGSLQTQLRQALQGGEARHEVHRLQARRHGLAELRRREPPQAAGEAALLPPLLASRQGRRCEAPEITKAAAKVLHLSLCPSLTAVRSRQNMAAWAYGGLHGLMRGARHLLDSFSKPLSQLDTTSASSEPPFLVHGRSGRGSAPRGRGEERHAHEAEEGAVRRPGQRTPGFYSAVKPRGTEDAAAEHSALQALLNLKLSHDFKHRIYHLNKKRYTSYLQFNFHLNKGIHHIFTHICTFNVLFSLKGA